MSVKEKQLASYFERGRVILSFLLIFFTAFLIISFYQVGSTVGTNTSAGVGQKDQPGQRIDLRTVAHHPDQFYGKEVTVRGEVYNDIGTRGMLIDSTGLYDSKMLIVSKQALIGVGGGPGDLLFKKDDGVQISGIVRRFKIDELEHELGIRLDRETFRQYENKPVIVADSIYPIEEL